MLKSKAYISALKRSFAGNYSVKLIFENVGCGNYMSLMNFSNKSVDSINNIFMTLLKLKMVEV